MDPLSILASVVTLAETGGTVSKVLRKCIEFKNAPDVLLALQNEITDLISCIGIKHISNGKRRRWARQMKSRKTNFRKTKQGTMEPGNNYSGQSTGFLGKPRHGCLDPIPFNNLSVHSDSHSISKNS